jgi:hypothetical protein
MEINCEKITLTNTPNILTTYKPKPRQFKCAVKPIHRKGNQFYKSITQK